MLDKWTAPLIQPPLRKAATWLKNYGITPDQVTVTGFVIGMIAIPLLAFEYYILALILIIGNRVFDGLDGALARLSTPSDAGGFLDITLDFIFYSGIVMGFALASPAANAVAACVLIFSFMGTGASFLAYAIMAEKHQLSDPHFKHKSLYYLGGLAEGTETILLFILFCLLPDFFPELALGFAAICMLTATLRVWSGYQSIDQAERKAP
ncbi:CDP-alcohol phosphatidyltransferase family protein [Endozoicomonas elysicola]|uniref:Membrane protein n=1 Tax=Endozoicomonas elysicola TaxID=305900 RepID=A0A081K8Y6_9GAMM|nr:CDP-alcohol phosphatidyltransferase family protein [Endozoicomonas elysicola]KEI70612.1 membrane protein [Endozoicomonas elysicola]